MENGHEKLAFFITKFDIVGKRTFLLAYTKNFLHFEI